MTLRTSETRRRSSFEGSYSAKSGGCATTTRYQARAVRAHCQLGPQPCSTERLEHEGATSTICSSSSAKEACMHSDSGSDSSRSRTSWCADHCGREHDRSRPKTVYPANMHVCHSLNRWQTQDTSSLGSTSWLGGKHASAKMFLAPVHLAGGEGAHPGRAPKYSSLLCSIRHNLLNSHYFRSMKARMKSGVDKAGKLCKFAEVKADFVHLTADAVQLVDTPSRRESAFKQEDDDALDAVLAEAAVELARDRLFTVERPEPNHEEEFGNEGEVVDADKGEGVVPELEHPFSDEEPASLPQFVPPTKSANKLSHFLALKLVYCNPSKKELAKATSSAG
eukprot:3511508-Amphidinium_carterae.2